MDQDPPPPPEHELRRRKFRPIHPSKAGRSRQPVQEEDDGQESGGLQRFTATVANRKPKAKPKSSVQVAFQAPTSSTSIKSYGTSSKDNGNNSKNTDLEPAPSGTVPAAPSPIANNIDEEVVHLPSLIAKNTDEEVVHLLNESDEDASAPNPASDYKEPWDYNSYYPTRLPIRRPFSGDPDLLDAEEFGEGAKNLVWDENTINSAKELGLTLEGKDKNKMMLFQLPPFPRHKQPPNAEGKEEISSSQSMSGSQEASLLKDLPGGYMGKWQVYKSGKIKWKIGDTFFDVSPGVPIRLPSDVAVINIKDKEFCNLGSVSEKVIVTPEIDSSSESD